MLSLVTGPTQDILNSTEFKNFARVDTTQDDDMINVILKAAISWVEIETHIDTMPRTWEQKLKGGVDEIELDRGPVQTINEVKYYDDFDSTGELLTESTDFRVVENYLLHESGHWDAMRDRDGYVINYTTGLFTNTSNSNYSLDTFKIAALKFALWVYENREMYVTGFNESYQVSYNTSEVPPEISRLLRKELRDIFF